MTTTNDAPELSAKDLQEALTFAEANTFPRAARGANSTAELMALYAREKVREAVAAERERIAGKVRAFAMELLLDHFKGADCREPNDCCGRSHHTITRSDAAQALAERIREGQ